jgi:hypothetical protein
VVQQTQANDTACSDHLDLRFLHPIENGDAVVVYAWSWLPTTNGVPGMLGDDSGNKYPMVVQNQLCGMNNAIAALYANYAVPLSTPNPVITFGPLAACEEATAIAVEYAGITAVVATQMINDGGGCPASPCSLAGGNGDALTSPAVIAGIAVSCAYAPSVFVTDQSGSTTLATESDTVTSEPGLATHRVVEPGEVFAQRWQITFASSGSSGVNGAVIAAFE